MHLIRSLKQPLTALVLLAVVLLAAAFSMTGCVQSLFYYPDDVLYHTPTEEGLKYEQVTFNSRDGTRLAGWFVPASDFADPRQAKGTVIFYHGNAQNLSAHWSFVKWLPKMGFNVFLFDYRGYGKSEGTPDFKGVFEDSDSALNYLRTRKDINPDKLLVFGQSLGGTNAIAVVGAGNRAGVKAIAIESTFYSYSSIANDKISGTAFLVNDTYSAANFVGKLPPIPLLLLHGTEDNVIPYAHSQRLLDQAHMPKRLLKVQGGGHIEAMTPQFHSVYRTELIKFFEAALTEK